MATHKEEFPPLLAPGFHTLTLPAIRAMCVTPFPSSTTRPAIMDGLDKFTRLLIDAGINAELWVNGSFMTQKLDPEDVDVVLAVRASVYESGTEAQQQLLDLIQVADFKADYFCHAFLFYEYDSDDPLYGYGEWMRAYWIRQFGFSRSVHLKGMALVQLG